MSIYKKALMAFTFPVRAAWLLLQIACFLLVSMACILVAAFVGYWIVLTFRMPFCRRKRPGASGNGPPTSMLNLLGLGPRQSHRSCCSFCQFFDSGRGGKGSGFRGGTNARNDAA